MCIPTTFGCVVGRNAYSDDATGIQTTFKYGRIKSRIKYLTLESDIHVLHFVFNLLITEDLKDLQKKQTHSDDS